MLSSRWLRNSDPLGAGTTPIGQVTRFRKRQIRERRPRQLALSTLDDRCLPSFLGPVNYPAGSNPAASATGLFNSDSIPDLVVANSGGSTVSVLIGNGDGTFQAPVNSATGANPNSVAVGDFNSDGKMDVATSNGGDNSVSILIGNGNGTFQAPVNMSLFDTPSAIAQGDLNGDGKIDLVATSNYWNPGSWGYYGYYPGWYTGHANVMIGNGTGAFAAPATTWIGDGFHTGAVAEDFNGDGRDDFAAANLDYGYATTSLSDAAGALQGWSDWFVGYYPGSIAAADLSSDGKADIVTANGYSGQVAVLLGDGLGGFGTVQQYSTGGSPVGVVLGDFNGLGGDGKLDVAVSTGSGNGAVVLLGRGNGTFLPPIPSTSDAYLSGITAGDFNGDGWLDAAAANSSGGSASVFVNDQTWPPLDAPSMTISDASVTEGNTGSVIANFTVTLSSAYGLPITVQYTTVDGTATAANGDYQPVSGTVTFQPNDTSKTIPITVFGDRNGEWNENFSVRLSAPTNAFITDPTGSGTIIDDEPTVSIVQSANGAEGNTSNGSISFTVTLSAAYDAPVSIDFATRDLTPDETGWYGPAAIAGVDYQSSSGTVTIPATETTGKIIVPTIGDRAAESDERFWVNLTNSPSARMVISASLGTVLDDEPRISINSPAQITEGDKGTKPLTFTVSLAIAYDQDVTVRYQTFNSSATSGSDYVATSGTLTIPAGQTSRTFTVQIKGDHKRESTESFYVQLSNPSSNATIWNGYGWGTILDDDGPRGRR